METNAFNLEGKKIERIGEKGGLKRELDKANVIFFAGKKRGRKIYYSPKLKRFYFMDEEAYETIGKHYNIAVKQLREKERKDRGFSGASFVFSGKCNLKCIYCYGRGGERKARKAEWKKIKAAIDYLSCFKEPIVLVFRGAEEPTLSLGLLKKTIEYANKKLKISATNLSTNGVISEKACKWLAENIDELQIALDGPPEIHDRQRPLKNGKPSSPHVIRTIKRLQKMGKDFRVRGTLTKSLMENAGYALRYLKELGVKKAAFLPLKPIGRAEEIEIPSVEEEKMGTMRIVELAEHYGIDIDLATIFPNGNTEKMGCSIGYNFALGVDGKVAGCPMYTGSEDTKVLPGIEEFIFGHFNENKERFEINWEKVSRMRAFSDKVMCGLCNFKLCWGGCPYENLHETGNIFIPSARYCSSNSGRFREMLKYHVQKTFFSKKPCLFEKNGKLIYSMYYNEFEMKKTKPKGRFSKNPFIAIEAPPEKKALCELRKKILSFHRNNPKRIVLFLLSLDFARKGKEEDLEALTAFFSSLKSGNVFFKATRPLRPFFDKSLGKKIELLEKEYGIPRNCCECLELFTVQGNHRVRFCNGFLGKKFAEFEDRDSIYAFFEKNNNVEGCPKHS